MDASVKGVWSMRSLLDSETKRGGGGEEEFKTGSPEQGSKMSEGCRDVSDVIIWLNSIKRVARVKRAASGGKGALLTYLRS